MGFSIAVVLVLVVGKLDSRKYLKTIYAQIGEVQKHETYDSILGISQNQNNNNNNRSKDL